MQPTRPRSLLTLPQLRIPRLLFFLLLLCLTTAVLPVGQEVSSASCHSPLSCGHFLVFCPSTQRAAVMFSPRGELRQAAGGRAGGADSIYRRPRAATIADASPSAGFHNMCHCRWFKSKKITVSFPSCPVLPK